MNFSDLLYETRFNTSETVKRLSKSLSEQDIEYMKSKYLISKQELMKKYLDKDIDENTLMINEMKEYMKIIIKGIINEYGLVIPEDRLANLKLMLESDSVVLINDPDYNHDFTAETDKGRVVINMARIGKNGIINEPDKYDKALTAKGLLPHELFHIILHMLKPAEIANERMHIQLSNGKEIRNRGMVGFMLNEGFVEKFAEEFCERNGLYYNVAPQYIPYINICNYVMESNPKINQNTIFSLDASECISQLPQEEQQLYYNAELVSFAVRHGKKETGEKINAEEVVGGYIELVQLDELSEESKEKIQSYYRNKNKKLQETLQGKFENKTL
jgi:hypothetical protein